MMMKMMTDDDHTKTTMRKRLIYKLYSGDMRTFVRERERLPTNRNNSSCFVFFLVSTGRCHFAQI